MMLSSISFSCTFSASGSRLAGVLSNTRTSPAGVRKDSGHVPWSKESMAISNRPTLGDAPEGVLSLVLCRSCSRHSVSLCFFSSVNLGRGDMSMVPELTMDLGLSERIYCQPGMHP